MIMRHWEWCYHNSKTFLCSSFMWFWWNWKILLVIKIGSPFGICTTNVIVKLSSSLVILQWLSFGVCESGEWCSHALMVERENYFQMILVIPNVLQCMHLALILLLYLACAFCTIVLYNCHMAFKHHLLHEKHHMAIESFKDM